MFSLTEMQIPCFTQEILVRMTAQTQIFTKVSFMNEQLMQCKVKLFPHICKDEIKKERGNRKNEKMVCKSKIKQDQVILILASNNETEIPSVQKITVAEP